MRKILLGLLLLCVVSVGGFLFWVHWSADNEAAARAKSIAFQSNYQALEVSSLKPNDTVSSVFPITGEANGYWFFDGTMSVEITDAGGALLWQGAAEPIGTGDIGDPVKFSIQADVGSYRGPAKILFIQTHTAEGIQYSTTTVPVVIK